MRRSLELINLSHDDFKQHFSNRKDCLFIHHAEEEIELTQQQFRSLKKLKLNKKKYVSIFDRLKNDEDDNFFKSWE